MESHPSSNRITKINNLSESAYVAGNINTSGGDFIGHDKYIQGDEVHGNKIIYQSLAFPRLKYRNDIAGVLDFYTNIFVGRGSEVERIINFAREQRPGYLLVEAPSGYGKTALIAHLVHLHETDHWQYPPTLLYFFIREEGGRNSMESFLYALNSQMLDLLGLEDSMPTGRESLHYQFTQLWSQAVAAANAEKPLLLLLDGLDEILDESSTIANELPTYLGNYVHLVVTSRPNPKPMEQVSLEHPFHHANVLRLQVFTTVDIQMLLTKNDLTVALDELLASRIFAITKGEPLFVRFVCQDVVEKGESVLTSMEENPPSDIDTYFHQQFAQLERLASGDLTWDILGLLTVTLGPITLNEIAEVLQINKHQARKAISPIRRFLLGVESHELMHLQLRRVLIGEFSTDRQKVYRKKLIDWCQNYQKRSWPNETPNYILNYYPQHIIDSGDRTTLYTIISKSWMNLKFNRTSFHDAFAKDVNLAIKVASEDGSSEGLVQLIRNCLIYASLGELISNSPPEILGVLAELGEITRAQGYAGLIQDAVRQSTAYWLIGKALYSQEELVGAKANLKRALKAAESIDDEWSQARVLCDLAQFIAEIGVKDELDCLMRIAETMKNDWNKSKVLNSVAIAFAQCGEYNLALKTGNMLDFDFMFIGKSRLLCGIAQMMGRNRKFELALNTAKDIEMESYKALALANIALAMVQAGEEKEAISTAKHALRLAKENDSDRIKVLCLVAQVTSLVNEQKQAKKMVNEACNILAAEKEPYIKVRILNDVILDIVHVEGHNGLKRILHIAEEIDNKQYKLEALSIVAQVKVKIGNTEEGIQIANRILDSAVAEKNVPALTHIIQTLAQVDKREAATQLKHILHVNTVTEGKGYAVEVLTKMVITMLQLQQNKQAELIATSAQQMAEGIQDEWYKVVALSGIVQITAHTKSQEKLKNLLQTVDSLSSELNKILALNGIVISLATGGDKEQLTEVLHRAFHVADSIERTPAKVWALCTIAHTLQQIDEQLQAEVIADYAISIAGTIQNTQDKAQALINVAQVLSQIDKIGQAIEIANSVMMIAETVLDPQFQSNILSSVAQVMVQTKDKEKLKHILGVADAIKDSQSTNSYDFKNIIQNLERKAFIRQLEIKSAKGNMVQTLTRIGEKILENLYLRFQFAAFIEDRYYRIHALCTVAKAFANTGDKTNALKIVNRALQATDTLPIYGPELLCQIVDLLLELGEIDRAVTTAETIPTIQDKEQALSHIVRALIQIKQLDRALQLASAIRITNYKAIALADIAQGLAQAGQNTQAWQVLRDALIRSCFSGQKSMFEVQKRSISMLMTMDQGQTLWRIYEVIMEVEDWWR